MLHYALNSVRRQDYDNWELVVVDDGSVVPARPIVDKFFKDDPRVKVVETYDSDEGKRRRGGSTFTDRWNQAIRESDATLAIILCDDDALMDGYLSRLNDYFNTHPQEYAAYSHVIVFDPFRENPYQVTEKRATPINLPGPTPMFCRVDASQTCWRTSCQKEFNLWFPPVLTRNPDAALYGQIDVTFGPSRWTGFEGQYKAVHRANLLHRTEDYLPPQAIDIPEVPEWALSSIKEATL
jgi:glycosyltransferase involved in cell wall biosynthesis